MNHPLPFKSRTPRLPKHERFVLRVGVRKLAELSPDRGSRAGGPGSRTVLVGGLYETWVSFFPCLAS
jgi:hypothetical protein